MRTKLLPDGYFWEPCKTCSLPTIISSSTSVYGGTISYGCSRCIIRVAEARGVRDQITAGMRALADTPSDHREPKP
jgi:hypothetical protein